MDWQKIIKDVLKHHEISQVELCRKTDISTSHINSLLLGKRKSPSFEMGLKIIKLHPNYKELLNA